MAGNHGPVGEERNGILIWLVMLCLYFPIGYAIAMFVLGYKKTLEEVAAFCKKDDLMNPILMIIPLLNLLVLLKYATALQEKQKEIGMPEGDQINPIVVVIIAFIIGFGHAMFQNSCNKTWEFAGGAPPAPPK